ncbi:Lamin Tail Domain [Methanophagales archaeon]|nr:Lamin Tail Domain [Methanophagales archaeon]
MTVFASGIAVGNQNPEMGDNGQGSYITEVFYDAFGLNNDGDILSLMAGNVIIVEVYPDTYISGDTAGEFVRIQNPTENSINLGGWHITDLIKGSKITFSEWANISAGIVYISLIMHLYFMTSCFGKQILSMVMIRTRHQIWIEVDGV